MATRQRNPHRRRTPTRKTMDRLQTNLLADMDHKLGAQMTSTQPSVLDVSLPLRSKKRNVPYTFWQTTQIGTVTNNNIAEADYAFSFALNNLSNGPSFEAIFDTYKIIGIKVKIIPTSGLATGGPPLYVVIDYDDASTLTIASMQQYDTLSIVPGGAYHERSLVPRMALAAFGGAFTSYAQQQDQWLDCASPGVLHYGVKCAIPQAATSNLSQWTILAEFIIQFRNVR